MTSTLVVVMLDCWMGCYGMQSSSDSVFPHARPLALPTHTCHTYLTFLLLYHNTGTLEIYGVQSLASVHNTSKDRHPRRYFPSGGLAFVSGRER